jgi:hypothetical protein
MQGLIPVVLTFGVKGPLVAGHDDCSPDGQADSREQRDKIDDERQTANCADRRRGVQSLEFVCRGRAINLLFHHGEDRVHSAGVYGVRDGRRVVAIDGQEQLGAGCDVGLVLVQHRSRHALIGAVIQDGHLSHGLLQGGFSRCVGGLRDRAGLEAILPLERLLGRDGGGRVGIRVGDSDCAGTRRGRIARHQGTNRNHADEDHESHAGPKYRPSIPRA